MVSPRRSQPYHVRYKNRQHNSIFSNIIFAFRRKQHFIHRRLTRIFLLFMFLNVWLYELFRPKEELDLPVIPHSHYLLDSAVYSLVGKMLWWMLVATLRFRPSSGWHHFLVHRTGLCRKYCSAKTLYRFLGMGRPINIKWHHNNVTIKACIYLSEYLMKFCQPLWFC